jgi:hypothetical protein
VAQYLAQRHPLLVRSYLIQPFNKPEEKKMIRTSHSGLIAVLVVTVALAALSLVAGPRVIAQATTQEFKVGDRVEIDTMYSQHPEKSTSWRKGTVVKTYAPEDHFGGLIIKMDEDGNEFRHRFVDTQWIRAPQGADAKPADDVKPADQTAANQPPTDSAAANATGNQPGANQTTTDANQTGAVSCPASDDLTGTSQPAIFRRLVADRYERDGKSRDENNKNVSVSIHFDDFKTGATHPYRHIINNPDGPDGVDGGTVYPVKTTYLVCEDYPGYAPTGNKGEIHKTQYENMTYSCFKDATGDWVCKQTGGREGRPQRTLK